MWNIVESSGDGHYLSPSGVTTSFGWTKLLFKKKLTDLFDMN